MLLLAMFSLLVVVYSLFSLRVDGAELNHRCSSSECWLQDIPSSCRLGPKADCPDFVSQQDWDSKTRTCCLRHPNTTYHCQEDREPGHEGPRLIVACLPSSACPQLGTIPVLQQNNHSGHVYVSKKCRPCEDEHFEPSPVESHHYRFPSCPDVHQICDPADGKILVRQGNTSHDATCTCDWKRGYSPFPNTTECRDLSGFTAHMDCHCFCATGTHHNSESECVPVTQTSRPSEPGLSTTPQPAPSLTKTKPSGQRPTPPPHSTPWQPEILQPGDGVREKGDSLEFVVYIFLGIVCVGCVICAVVKCKRVRSNRGHQGSPWSNRFCGNDHDSLVPTVDNVSECA